MSQRPQERSKVWQRKRIIKADSLSKNLKSGIKNMEMDHRKKKRELGSEWVAEKDKVHGLPFRGAKAYNSTITINFWVWTMTWAAEHNQQTEESRQRDTSLKFSVYVVGWGQGSITMCPRQAHSTPEFECHQLHRASSSSLLFVMTAPLVSELTSLCRRHSMLPLLLLADPEQKIGCLINSPRIGTMQLLSRSAVPGGEGTMALELKENVTPC